MTMIGKGDRDSERNSDVPTGRGVSGDASTATLALLAARAATATVCPSEVARALVAGTETGNWRDAMPVVHAAIDRLVEDGSVRLSWKGKTLPKRAGPYRIGRGVAD